MNIRYSDILEMADRHTIMKLLMKDTADRMGMSVTFMAKPVADQAATSTSRCGMMTPTPSPETTR